MKATILILSMIVISTICKSQTYSKNNLSLYLQPKHQSICKPNSSTQSREDSLQSTNFLLKDSNLTYTTTKTTSIWRSQSNTKQSFVSTKPKLMEDIDSWKMTIYYTDKSKKSATIYEMTQLLHITKYISSTKTIEKIEIIPHYKE